MSITDKFPMIERPTPVVDFLRTRPTFVMDTPLVESLSSGKGISGLSSKLSGLGKGGGLGKLGKGKGLGILDKLKSR